MFRFRHIVFSHSSSKVIRALETCILNDYRSYAVTSQKFLEAATKMSCVSRSMTRVASIRTVCSRIRRGNNLSWLLLMAQFTICIEFSTFCLLAHKLSQQSKMECSKYCVSFWSILLMGSDESIVRRVAVICSRITKELVKAVRCAVGHQTSRCALILIVIVFSPAAQKSSKPSKPVISTSSNSSQVKPSTRSHESVAWQWKSDDGWQSYADATNKQVHPTY